MGNWLLQQQVKSGVHLASISRCDSLKSLQRKLASVVLRWLLTALELLTDGAMTWLVRWFGAIIIVLIGGMEAAGPEPPLRSLPLTPGTYKSDNGL